MKATLLILILLSTPNAICADSFNWHANAGVGGVVYEDNDHEAFSDQNSLRNHFSFWANGEYGLSLFDIVGIDVGIISSGAMISLSYGAHLKIKTKDLIFQVGAAKANSFLRLEGDNPAGEYIKTNQLSLFLGKYSSLLDSYIGLKYIHLSFDEEKTVGTKTADGHIGVLFLTLATANF